MVGPEVRSRQGMQTVPWVNLSSWTWTKSSRGRGKKDESFLPPPTSLKFSSSSEVMCGDTMVLFSPLSWMFGEWLACFDLWCVPHILDWVVRKKNQGTCEDKGVGFGRLIEEVTDTQHMSATLDNLEFHTLDSLFLDCPTSFLLSLFFQNALTLQLWYV